ncbi:MAG: hypothetical protein HQL31_05835 [Planctomycetes bacterium]|nr:hypothetical protein [Planctomycetota bacterium]
MGKGEITLSLGKSIAWVMVYTRSERKYVQDIWIEKESGEGPYKLRSGHREEEQGVRADLSIMKEELEIKRTTSLHQIQFSTLPDESVQFMEKR